MYKREYAIYGRPTFNTNEVHFNGVDYVLESIDFGEVQEELQDLEYQIGTHYTTSRLGKRDIDIVCWVVNREVNSTYSPSITEVSLGKRTLQNVVKPFSESYLVIRDTNNYEATTPTWTTIASIGVRLASSIEWATSKEENNAFGCKCVMHLVATDPLFYAPIIKSAPDSATGNLKLPFEVPGSTGTDRIGTYGTNYLSLENIGYRLRQPFFIKLNLKTASALSKVRVYDYYNSSVYQEYNIRGSSSVSTTTPIRIDLANMTCQLGWGTEEPLVSGSQPIYSLLDETFRLQARVYDTSNNQVDVICGFSESLSSNYDFSRSGIGFLGV